MIETITGKTISPPMQSQKHALLLHIHRANLLHIQIRPQAARALRIPIVIAAIMGPAALHIERIGARIRHVVHMLQDQLHRLARGHLDQDFDGAVPGGDGGPAG